MEEKILAAAEEYLAAGYSIIPVGTEKVPLIKWTKYQSQRPTMSEVEAWHKQFPDMQLGIVTGAISGLVVIDVEYGGDPSLFPPTLTSKTGGNGVHLYYRHPGAPVKNDVRVMDLVDIRGDGGYVVAPPSISTKGEYKWLHDPKNTELTLYPVELMQTLTQTATDTLVQTGERNVTAAQKVGEILANMPAAHQRNDAWVLTQKWNQDALAVPMTDGELQKVFRSIAKRQDAANAEQQVTLTPFTLRELYAEEFPDTEWLVDKLIPLGMMSAITGESSSYKTFITQAMAQAVATGTPFLDHFPVTQGKVLIVDEENNKRIINGRFKALNTKADDNIMFLARTGIQLTSPTFMAKLRQVIATHKPVLVILDSLVRFHSNDENSATEMSKVMKAINSLTAPMCTVVFIHHHKKEQGFGKTSGSNSVRGSTDIFNALDCHLGIQRTGNVIKITQHKLRMEPELPMFTVQLTLTDGRVSFQYEGVDTTKQDELNATKEIILEMLRQADEDKVNRKELVAGSKMPDKTCTEALKELVAENLIIKEKGSRNSHVYLLAETAEDEETKGEEIN